MAVSPTLRAGGNRTGGDRPPGTDVDTADSLIIQGGGPENGQIAGTVSRKWAKGSGGPAGDECYNMVAFAECGHFCGMSETQAADPLLAKGGYCGNGSEAVCVTGPVTHALKAEGCDGSEDGTGRGQPIIAFPANLSTTQHASAEDISPAMGAKNPTGVAFEPRCARNGRGMPEEIVPPLKAQSGMTGKGDSAPCVATALSVRRLTPVECERLMGLPDNYTRIPSWSGWKKLDDGEDPAQLTAEGLEVKQNKKTGKWRVKDVDGPRYKALGNSMAVPVMRWILKNIRSQS